MLPRDFQPGDYWQGRMPGGGSFLPNYGGLHPMLGAGLTAPSASTPTPTVAPVTAPNSPPPPPPPAPISPLLAMAMQQQMGAAQPQAQGMPQPQGMGAPQGQMPSGGQYQNFIPPIQATPFNYQGGQQPLPIGGMWNQVAQQMAGPGFMQPGTSAMYSGFNPALVAPPQGPHNIAAPASASTGSGIANLGNLGLVNSMYSPYSGGSL